MPLVVRPHQLQPGMRLSAAVRRGPVTLLTGGRTLSDDDIAALVRRYPQQRVSIVSEALDKALTFEDPGRDRTVAEKAQERCRSAIEIALHDGDPQSKPSRRDEAFDRVSRAVDEIIAYLVAHPVKQVFPRDADADSPPQSYLIDHMSACFHLAMQLGTAARDYVVSERMRQTHSNNLSYALAQSLLPLGLGAIYMDIGMQELAELELRDGPLSESDWQRIHQHPERGAAMLPERFPPAGRMVVRTHHENLDRTGYPNRPRPEKMHVFTRLIRIVDAFDAGVTPRPYRKAKSALRVLWEMARGPSASRFDPMLVKLFMDQVAPLPPGQMVQLTDGRYAVVTARGKDPFAPVVNACFDEQGDLLPADRLGKSFSADGRDQRPRLARVDDEDVAYLASKTG